MNIGDSARIGINNRIQQASFKSAQEAGGEANFETTDVFKQSEKDNIFIDPKKITKALNSLSSFSYSGVGKSTAKSFYEEADLQTSPSMQRKILKDGFNTIISSVGSTEDEKFISRVGLFFGQSGLPDKEAAGATLPVMNAIATGRQGKPGEILAKLTLESAESVRNPKLARLYTLQTGFEAIKSSPKTSQNEKYFAIMGIEFGGKNINSDDDAVYARKCVFEAIAGGITPPMAKALAKTSRNAVESIYKDVNKKAILETGFNAIIYANSVSEIDKNNAKLGISVMDNAEYESEAVRKGFKIMQKFTVND